MEMDPSYSTFTYGTLDDNGRFTGLNISQVNMVFTQLLGIFSNCISVTHSSIFRQPWSETTPWFSRGIWRTASQSRAGSRGARLSTSAPRRSRFSSILGFRPSIARRNYPRIPVQPRIKMTTNLPLQSLHYRDGLKMFPRLRGFFRQVEPEVLRKFLQTWGPLSIPPMYRIQKCEGLWRLYG